VPVLDDACAQPFADEPQDPLVRDPVLQKLPQPSMIKAGEKVADVRIEHPVHLLPPDPNRERIQRLMRVAPGPKTVGKAPEIRLVNGVEHLDDGPLKDLVLHRGDGDFILPLLQSRVGIFPRVWMCWWNG